MLLTVQEFVTRIGEKEALQLANAGTRDLPELDEARVIPHLAAASDLIGGYVRARYPLAMQYPPEALKGWCADIARWYLRGQGGPTSDMAEVVKDRYDEAMKALRDVSAGRLTLDIDAPGASAGEAENLGANSRVSSLVPQPRTPAVMEGW